MNPVVAVIPTRFDVSHLITLLPSLEDVRMLYILDNGLNQENFNLLQDALLGNNNLNDVMIIRCPELSIYQMWNMGWLAAIRDFGINAHIAILNDDIHFPPGTLSILSQYLEQNKDVAAICPDYSRSSELGIADNLELQYTTSTFGNNGLAGFAFMVRGELPIKFDEQHFGWWYGDDDFVKRVEELDLKVAKVIGLPVSHNQGNSYKYIRDELEKQIELDRQYFNLKYSENRQRW